MQPASVVHVNICAGNFFFINNMDDYDYEVRSLIRTGANVSNPMSSKKFLYMVYCGDAGMHNFNAST